MNKYYLFFMNVKILFPIACLVACGDNKPPKEKSTWDKLGEAGKQGIFSDDSETFKNFVNAVKKNIKKKSIDFTGTYDEIIGLINDTNLKSSDVSKIISGSTTIDKAGGKWILTKLV